MQNKVCFFNNTLTFHFYGLTACDLGIKLMILYHHINNLLSGEQAKVAGQPYLIQRKRVSSLTYPLLVIKPRSNGCKKKMFSGSERRKKIKENTRML